MKLESHVRKSVTRRRSQSLAGRTLELRGRSQLPQLKCTPLSLAGFVPVSARWLCVRAEEGEGNQQWRSGMKGPQPLQGECVRVRQKRGSAKTGLPLKSFSLSSLLLPSQSGPAAQLGWAAHNQESRATSASVHSAGLRACVWRCPCAVICALKA